MFSRGFPDVNIDFRQEETFGNPLEEFRFESACPASKFSYFNKLFEQVQYRSLNVVFWLNSMLYNSELAFRVSQLELEYWCHKLSQDAFHPECKVKPSSKRIDFCSKNRADHSPPFVDPKCNILHLFESSGRGMMYWKWDFWFAVLQKAASGYTRILDEFRLSICWIIPRLVCFEPANITLCTA